ncbi:MAG: glycosyltransferase family 4 protein [Ahrensia sp.]|nr:glycosyltransferase family 4 protein [Ahrensia sp.]
MRIAFYAPIKPPDHPIASGDRLIARNLIAAMRHADHNVDLASAFIAYSKRPEDDILQQRKAEALQEARAVFSRLSPAPPDCWVTYHPYCKAPDWIGPFVCKALSIPYVTVEAARTGQGFENGGDLWRNWRAEAQSGIRSATLHLCFKPTDRDYLRSLGISDQQTAMIPPFIDTQSNRASSKACLPEHWRDDWPILMTAGMMRPGKKVENYRRIAEALKGLQALHWTFVAVGDGPEAETIKGFFETIDPTRLHFAGAVDHADVINLMRQSDVFVWPGWKEPIGMVYLEAQLCGLPVCALESMGVPLVVRHGQTGLLSPQDHAEAFRENLAQLVSHPSLRSDLSRNAKAHVESYHSLIAVSAIIDRALREKLTTL